MSDVNWFAYHPTNSAAPARVFCFAHAGGNPRAYLDWQRLLDHDAQVVAVCPPGPRRDDQSALASVADLAAAAAVALSTAMDRPSYLFGHSLGALVAFEVARRLRGHPQLHRLIASGCAAPSLLPSERVRRIAHLQGREFAEAVAFFGGLPNEVLGDDDLRELLLPAVAADFRLVARYRYRPAAPLSLPVSLVNGRDDPHIDASALDPWRRDCQEEPDRHWAEGGHFYLVQQPSAPVKLIRSFLRDDALGATSAGTHTELI